MQRAGWCLGVGDVEAGHLAPERCRADSEGIGGAFAASIAVFEGGLDGQTFGGIDDVGQSFARGGLGR